MNSAHSYSEGAEVPEDKTRSNDVRDVRNFDMLKKSLNALYAQVPPEVADDVTKNILPYVIDLRYALKERDDIIKELLPLAERTFNSMARHEVIFTPDKMGNVQVAEVIDRARKTLKNKPI